MRDRYDDGSNHRPHPGHRRALIALALTVAAVTATGFGVTLARQPVTHEDPARVNPNPVVIPPATVGTTTTSTPVIQAPGTTTQPDPAPTARGFLDAWLTPATPDQRAALLAPVTTGEYLPIVAAVPIEALPAGPVTSLTATGDDGMTASVDFRLADGTAGTVTLVYTAAGWRANAVDRAMDNIGGPR